MLVWTKILHMFRLATGGELLISKALDNLILASHGSNRRGGFILSAMKQDNVHKRGSLRPVDDKTS